MKNIYVQSILVLVLIFLAGISNFCFSEGVDIWDNDTSDWITTFADGDPIDAATGNPAYAPQLSVDCNGRLYVTYYQYADAYRIYLSRYDGTDVEIWDTGTLDWTDTFSNGDPIDAPTGFNTYAPQIAVDSSGRVYVTYYNTEGHLYLSRYDGTSVKIWGNGGWTTTFSQGIPIDVATGYAVYAPQIAVDSSGRVYITYYQSDGGANGIYLNCYDDANGVQIWGNSGWTTTFAQGIPIDATVNSAYAPQLAVDSSGSVYVVYRQVLGEVNRIYLSRYDDTNGVQIWGNSGWTATFSEGTPIDPGTQNCGAPQLAIDLNGNVYITYAHEEPDSVYLNRYDGTDVRIWDNGTSSWITNFANGDSIDTGSSYANNPQVAVDSSGMVYVVYQQEHDQLFGIYLSRYDGNDVQIWGSGGWTDTFSNGIPIDPSTQTCGEPQLAVDLNDNVYITYAHGGIGSVYLNRCDGTDVYIWDNDTLSWITNFANGSSIDPGDGYAVSPQIAVDLNDVVYVTYMYGQGGVQNSRNGLAYRIYLNRYVPEASSYLDHNHGTGPHCFMQPIFSGITASADNNEIIALRHFRDKNLLTNPLGEIFVGTYYKVAPPIAKLIMKYPSCKGILRGMLKPVIWFCEKTLEK